MFSFVYYRGCFFNAATFVPLQIQDARNHVNQAIYLLMNRDVNYHFKTGSEVLKVRRKALQLSWSMHVSHVSFLCLLFFWVGGGESYCTFLSCLFILEVSRSVCVTSFDMNLLPV